MEGVLFKWGPKGVHVAFRSPPKAAASFKRHVVLIGGLTDGLLPTPYTVQLGQSLELWEWGLVQTLLSSSYSGYGTASLEQDTEEMDGLLGYLATELQATQIVLAGHSTGCQDIVHYMARAASRHRRLVAGTILQGPASDREYMATQTDTRQWLALAQSMAATGQQQELLPRAANEAAPITAERYLSLAGMDGPDDLFSSDLSDEDLAARLGHMASTPALVLFSAEDEYVPSTVDKQHLVERLCKALGRAKGVLVEKGDHALSVGQDVAIAHILEFLKQLEQ